MVPGCARCAAKAKIHVETSQIREQIFGRCEAHRAIDSGLRIESMGICSVANKIVRCVSVWSSPQFAPFFSSRCLSMRSICLRVHSTCFPIRVLVHSSGPVFFSATATHAQFSCFLKHNEIIGAQASATATRSGPSQTQKWVYCQKYGQPRKPRL